MVGYKHLNETKICTSKHSVSTVSAQCQHSVSTMPGTTQCAMINKELLTMLDDPDGAIAWLFFHRLQKTDACDHIDGFRGMKDIRTSVAEHMGVHTDGSVAAGCVNKKDKQRAADALSKYKDQLRTELAKASIPPVWNIEKYLAHGIW